MKTVNVSIGFDGDLHETAERCQTLDSRKNWPGAVLMGGGGERLFYQVSMRLKAAMMTDIDIEENQSAVTEREDGSLSFTTTQQVTWPDGQAAAETEYVFAPGGPGGSGTLTFTYRYEPPPSKLVKKKALPDFHVGMEKVATRYVKGLVETPVPA